LTRPGLTMSTVGCERVTPAGHLQGTGWLLKMIRWHCVPPGNTVEAAVFCTTWSAK